MFEINPQSELWKNHDMLNTRSRVLFGHLTVKSTQQEDFAQFARNFRRKRSEVKEKVVQFELILIKSYT